MEMERISYSLRDLLVAQGVANARPVGAGKVRGMKGPGAAMERAHRQLETGNPEGGHGYPPIGRQGGAQPMGNSGKGPGVNGPAKGTVLTRDMAQPAHVRRKKAANAHLRLVWSA